MSTIEYLYTLSKDKREFEEWVNAQSNEFGLTALHLACFNSRLDVAKFLLDAGAKVDAYDNMKRTPLHLACFNRMARGLSKASLVKLLLERGASVDAVDMTGKTVLHYCTPYNDSELLEAILDKVSDKKKFVSHQDNLGNTALHYINEHSLKGVQKILEIAPELGLTANNQGWTPLHQVTDVALT